MAQATRVPSSAVQLSPDSRSPSRPPPFSWAASRRSDGGRPASRSLDTRCLRRWRSPRWRWLRGQVCRRRWADSAGVSSRSGSWSGVPESSSSTGVRASSCLGSVAVVPDAYWPGSRPRADIPSSRGSRSGTEPLAASVGSAKPVAVASLEARLRDSELDRVAGGLRAVFLEGCPAVAPAEALDPEHGSRPVL